MVSLIISLRLLGIFLMLPVFSVFAVRYPGATLPLAGIAFGVYPLTQSFLQIPLGWASDRWGRKPLILFGLLLFTVGSLICGFARDIVELIVARAIQGSGAIASVALAALADLTRPSVRAQAFTVTGIVIGATFMLGLPTETPQQTEKTVRFAIDSGIDYAIFGITEPFPGTELWVDAQKFGYFDDSGRYQNNLLSENAAVWIPHGRTRDELKDAVRNAMRRFYLRPRALWRSLKNFYHLPTGRAARYLWAGVVFFVIGHFRRSHLAHMGTRN